MNSTRKGIVLSGGLGSRLFPLTLGTSKQLMPVYDKPMIYYPISTLMLAGIKEILIITTKQDLDSFKRLLGDGSSWGIKLNYIFQESPDGIAQAFILGEDFLGNSNSALILGDNLFHGEGFLKLLREADSTSKGCSIFSYPVMDPERYGVISFDKNKIPLSIDEKPLKPKSNHVVTGLYFYDNSVLEKAKKIKPSARGELEITSINNLYLQDGLLNLKMMGRGSAWLDTGTFDSLQDAGVYIRTLEKRQGLKVCCPEEIAWRNKWISDKDLEKLASKQIKSGYGKYLMDLIKSSYLS